MKSSKKINFNILTLGCSKNAVDSETIISQLSANEFRYSPDSQHPDLLIINTCGFIGPAKEESTGLILEATEMKKRGKIKKLIVAGCLSERYNQELSSQIPEVDHFFGINPSKDILRVYDKEEKFNLIGELRKLTPPHYAYIKISDGCDNPCSFCAIPLIRSKHKTRPESEIVREVQSLASNGTKEFLLIAQDSTYYGKDSTGNRDLPRLLNKLSDISGVEWLRLMYAYPTKFPFEVLDIIADKPNICKYIDIPLQHISDSVLKSMRRGSTRRYIEELITKIRKTIPDVAIRSTFIVGYPNEEERDFDELLDFIKSIELDRIGVFTYSREENTTAFDLGDPIPNEVKIERRNRIMEAQMNISLKKNKEKIGRTLKVLIDDYSGNEYIGRSEYDAPEVDNSVIIRTKKRIPIGSFQNVLIKDAMEYDLIGKLI